MSMKRFLILSILILFLTVSCAGPNKVGWTKPDFTHDQFVKDQNECIDSIDKNLNSEAFEKALDECLAQKGYKFHQAKKLTPEKVLLIVVLIPVFVAVGVGYVILSSGPYNLKF